MNKEITASSFIIGFIMAQDYQGMDLSKQF